MERESQLFMGAQAPMAHMPVSYTPVWRVNSYTLHVMIAAGKVYLLYHHAKSHGYHTCDKRSAYNSVPV